jgi:hypothetical protein
VSNIELRRTATFVNNYGVKTSEQASLKVMCPVCGAAPGIPCELSSGGPRNAPHRDRVWMARDVLFFPDDRSSSLFYGAVVATTVRSGKD